MFRRRWRYCQVLWNMVVIIVSLWNSVWLWLMRDVIYFHMCPVERSDEAGQTQTGCLSADPAGRDGVRSSWRQMERLSNQTCERLFQTLSSSFCACLCFLFFLHVPAVFENISLSDQQGNNFHMLRPGEDVLEEEKQETVDAPFFFSHHECPLIQQKVIESPACNWA